MNKCSQCKQRIGLFKYKELTHCYNCFIKKVEDNHSATNEQLERFKNVKMNEDTINSLSEDLSKTFKIDLESAQEEVIRGTKEAIDEIRSSPGVQPINELEPFPVEKKKRKKKKRAIDTYGTNLVAKMRKSDQLLIGREDVIQSTLHILQRKYKNNPLIVGDAGVGKTAIVEGIAKMIADGNIDGRLRNKKIYSIDVADLFAGTKFRGDLEKRIQMIIKEAKEDKNVILYFDEFHNIIHGSNNDMDIGQIFKPHLARGEVQMIGSTTLDEYRTHIEKDDALSRRVQKITLQEPNEDETFEIIKGIKHQFEDYHAVHISEEIINEAIYLTGRYLPHRSFPDKVIDLIDEATTHRSIITRQDTKYDNLLKELDATLTLKEELIEQDDLDGLYQLIPKEKELKKQLKQKPVSLAFDDLSFILEKWIGIPSSKMAKEDLSKLKNIENVLKEKVKGQDEAISLLSKTVRRSMVGLQEEDKPLGSFLFLGPTGVGKTELSKALTTFLFGSEKFLIRMDMSEYMEQHSVSKLIGSPPGYVGYKEEGILTKKIRENPYSVVLFDEFEKAHPDVQKILLQLLDEGRITNGSGMTVDAKNCYFIMTSNIGSEMYHSKKTSLGFQKVDKDREIKVSVMDELKKVTKPEFINRIDTIITFNSLGREVMCDIVTKFTNSLKDLVSRKGYNLELTHGALDYLAEKGYEPEYGARPVKRLLNDVKDLVSDSIIDNPLNTNITIGAKLINKEKQFYVKQ